MPPVENGLPYFALGMQLQPALQSLFLPTWDVVMFEKATKRQRKCVYLLEDMQFNLSLTFLCCKFFIYLGPLFVVSFLFPAFGHFQYTNKDGESRCDFITCSDVRGVRYK